MNFAVVIPGFHICKNLPVTSTRFQFTVQDSGHTNKVSPRGSQEVKVQVHVHTGGRASPSDIPLSDPALSRGTLQRDKDGMKGQSLSTDCPSASTRVPGAGLLPF